MPGYSTHLKGGFFVFSVTFLLLWKIFPQYSTLPHFLLFLALALLGSLFPDLDVTSRVQRWFYRLICVIYLFLLLKHQTIELCILSIVAITVGLLRHRTILHDMRFLAFFPFVIIAILTRTYTIDFDWIVGGAFFALGAGSHVFLDRGIKRGKRRRRYR